MDLPKPPQDQELKNIIDKLAQFVARNGPEFEQMTKQKQKDNLKFAFLFGGEFFNYYQYRVTSEQAILKQKQRNIEQQQQAIVQHAITQQSIHSAPWQQQQQQIQQQIQDIQEQIRQSEQNLAAQHQLLLQQQQIQVDEAVRKGQEEKLSNTAKECNIELSDFDKVLIPIIDSCTKDAISAGKGWIFTHATTNQQADLIAEHILKRITAPGTTFETKLHLVYLINDLLHHCMRKNADELKKSINKVVVPIFCTTSIGIDPDKQQKLLKLFKLWDTHKYFEPHILEQLQNPSASLANYQASLITEHAVAITPITNAIQVQYNQLQKQHQDFVAHLTSQIQQLQSQNQLQTHPVQQTQQQPQPQQAAPPPQQQPQQQLYLVQHQQPTTQSLDSTQNQSHLYGQVQTEDPVTSAAVVAAVSVASQMAAGQVIPTSMGSLPIITSSSEPSMAQSISSSGSHYGGHPSVQSSQSHLSNGPPPSEYNDSQSHYHSTSYHQSSYIPSTDYNHGSLPAVQTTQFNQGPQQYSHQGPSGFPSDMMIVQQQQADYMDHILPSVPYFDLPAGLMVPLVMLEDCDYQPLEPDDIRLPPPAPPTERLLAAVEQFYAVPTHERPRNSEGWEQLGLYEFFKAKARAKKKIQGIFDSDEEDDELQEAKFKIDMNPPLAFLKACSKSISPPRRRYRESKSPPIKELEMVQIQSQIRNRSKSRSRSRSRSKSRSRSPSPRRHHYQITRSPPKSRSPSRSRSRSKSRSRSRSRSRSTSPVQRTDRSPTPPSFYGSTYSSGPIDRRLDENNKGHQLLKRMGWSGAGLGATEQGIQDPINPGDVRDRQDMYKGIGINLNDPYENFRKSKGQAFINRMKARAEELGKM